ncbi:MAG: Uma2 family endonuclease [Gemmataceae bacterium]|nr:Uma2 family endonuclease [Gemmataceae bacterium]
MSTTKPRSLIEYTYEAAAQDYLRGLTLENLMEATTQATQRKITLESFDLIHVHRPDLQIFNELLLQYPIAGQHRPGQVVPDNMVIRWHEPIKADGSYDLPLQPCGPLVVPEYVSKSNKRKDYETNFDRYEQLKVPYYLYFFPDIQDLTLYRHTGAKYVAVAPNERERLPLPELELEVGLLEGWLRYWFRGELVPLPADLQHALTEARRELEEERARADQEHHRADEQTRRADEQTRRADEQTRRADEQTRRADKQMQCAEEERQARLAAEEELARMRAELEKLRGGRTGPA